MQRDKREDYQKSQRKLYKPLSLSLSPSLFLPPFIPLSLPLSLSLSLCIFPTTGNNSSSNISQRLSYTTCQSNPSIFQGHYQALNFRLPAAALSFPLSYSHTRQTYYFPLHSLFSIHLHSICGPMNLHCRKWRVKCVECGMWKVANPTQVSCCAPLADPLLPRPGARPGHLSGQLRIDPHLTLDLGLPFSRIARVAPNSFPHGPKRSLTLAIWGQTTLRPSVVNEPKE